MFMMNDFFLYVDQFYKRIKSDSVTIQRKFVVKLLGFKNEFSFSFF